MDRGAWWATLHGVAQSQTQFSDLILCRRLLCDSHCGWRWPWDQTTQAACRDGGGLREEEGLDCAGFQVRARAGRWEPHGARYSRISGPFSQLQPSQTPAALRGGVSVGLARTEPSQSLQCSHLRLPCQRSLVGYSPWGRETFRHDLVTKHQQ